VVVVAPGAASSGVLVVVVVVVVLHVTGVDVATASSLSLNGWLINS